MCLKNNGITAWSKSEQIDNDSALRILTVTSPTTDALIKLLPHFTKTTGVKAVLTIKTFEEIYQILASQNHANEYDIIRMDMAWLPWLGRDVFQPLLHLDDHLRAGLIQSLPQHMKDNYSHIDETPHAIPFDPSIQMLFYRKDLFEDPKVKRMYYEKFKKQLAVPADFESFNEIAAFFTQSHSTFPQRSMVRVLL